MRSILESILLGGIFLLGTFSCTTVPKASLARGEVRLLSIESFGAGIKANTSFPVGVFFETGGEPEIQRACFYRLWREPYCSDVIYATFGTKKIFLVQLPGANPGSYRVECYIEYIQNGEIRKTNVIAAQFLIGN